MIINKKAKAFTLIELIGVVVILGILMILVFPSILNNVRKTQGEINETTKTLLLNATELYVDQNKNKYTPYNESVYCITIQELLDHNMVKPEIVKDIDKTKVIQVKTSNNNTDYELKETGNCQSTAVSTWVKADASNHGIDGAAYPDLESNMIPIKYRTLEDTTDRWYDYNQKIWANAVIVKESVKEKYKNAKVGTEIQEEDILAYFVWIPRYRYKLWNVEGTDNNARSIEIEFESTTTPISTGSTNNTWLTHPGFCIGRTGDPTVTVGNYGTNRSSCSGTEVNGFWVGKFEPSIGSLNETNEVKTSGVIIKPNQISLTYQNVVNQFNTAWSVQTQYGLNSNYISRMMRNTEWGAVAYLTHSKYGIGVDRVRYNNTTIAPVGTVHTAEDAKNPSVTGCSYKTEEAPAYSITSCNTENTVPYNDLQLGVKASTTGNIYGIYDMAGGSMDKTASCNLLSDGTQREDDGELYGKVDEKYYDLYGPNADRKNYTTSRLGDSIKEVINQGAQLTWYNATSGDMIYAEIDNAIRGSSYYAVLPEDIIAIGRHGSKDTIYRDTFRIVLNKQ